MTVSTLVSRAPTMIYFGQMVGEDGSEEPGFGDPTRTSIFDYIGVPAHQRWMNDGEFDGAELSAEQRELRRFYVELMALNQLPAIAQGNLVEVSNSQPQHVVSFIRQAGNQRVLVVANFAEQKQQVSVDVKESQVQALLGALPQFADGTLSLTLPYQGVSVIQLGSNP
jgi:neopullulanase